MITDTDKRRAVFLAILMVLSVFAGTLAFSGSVAAVNDPRADGGSISNTTVSASSTNTHSVVLNATLNASNDSNVNYNVSFSSGDNFDLSGADNSTVQVSSGNANVSETSFDDTNDNVTVNVSTNGDGGNDETVNLTFDITGVDAPGDSATQNYPIAFGLNEGPDSTTESEINIGTITVEGPQSTQEYQGGAVHYNNTSTSGATIEVPFDGDINANSITAENFTVLDDGDDVSDTLVDYTASRDQHDSSGQVNLVTTEVRTSNDLEVELSSQVASNDGEKSVAFAATAIDYNDLDGSNEFNEYRGTTITFYNASGVSDFTIEDDEDGFSYFQSFSSGTNSEVFYLDTSDRNLGDYNLNDPNQNLTIRDLGLNVTIDETNVTTEDEIEGTVDSVASNRDIEIELVDDGGDGDTVASRDVQTSGQGDFDFTFDADRDEGDYTVQVTDTGSGVEVESSTVTISEASDDDADFVTSSINVDRGDIAEITVETDGTDFASISFGDAEDQGVEANATVEDEDGDGQVTVYLNTYQLVDNNSVPGTINNDEAFAVDSDSDDSVTNQEVTSNTSDLLDSGEYDLEVTAGEEQYAEDEDGVATFTVEERGTENIQMWTGSSGELSISELEDVTEGVENGEITQSEDIAVGDLAVHQIEVSGLEGALDARENEDVTGTFLTQAEGNITELTIEDADPGANQEADTLALGEDNVSVIADGPNDTYYVVVDTEGPLRFNGGNQVPDDDDTELETNFTVLGDDFASPGDYTSDELDDDENEETLVEFTAEEPDVTINEPFNASQATDQSFSGTTNIAPGTEMRLRIRSQSGTSPSFLKTSTPVVQSDGTFSAAFGFSEQNIGDEYDIIVRNTLLNSEETEEGQVVEAVETATPTPEPDTDTATSEPGTDTAEPDTGTATPDEQDTQTSMPTTDAGTETPTSTPGFGVVVALTALLAAALLATRRES